MHFGITQNADENENENARANLTIKLYILTVEICLP
jgi:hypothetical protein